MKSSGLECISDETCLGYHFKNCFFPSADCVIQSFKTGERLPHQNSEENASLQPLCPVSARADINGLQCQEWRMVLSHLGAQSSLGRHEPPPALGLAGRGCVCMRMGAQEHIFPTRAAFNYTTVSWAEAGILAKGFFFFFFTVILSICTFTLKLDNP